MAEVIWDTKSDVQKASRAALEKLCALVSNKDIERFIPALIQSLIHPVEEVPKTIQLLSATTFVQEVDSPTLALMTPLLSRGLTERPTATKRKVAVIIDNMSKLVDNERTVRPFLPKLLPGLIKIETTVSDPEARSVVQRAINTLRQVGKVTGDGSDVKPIEDVDLSKTIELVNEQLKKNGLTGPDTLVHYVAQLVTNLANFRMFEPDEWEGTLSRYLSLFRPSSQEKSHTIVHELLRMLAKSTGEEVEVFDDEEEGEDLCNCQFSKVSHRLRRCVRGTWSMTLMAPRVTFRSSTSSSLTSA